MLDLFTPMDALDRDRYWTDTFHFQPDAVDTQARLIASHCLSALFPENGAGAARARDFEERSDDVGISRPAGPGIWRRQIRKGRKAEGG